MKGIGDILLSSDHPNETPLTTPNENEKHDEEDNQSNKKSIGRSQSFVKSSVFMWGGNGAEYTMGGLNSRISQPLTAKTDNDVITTNYSNTARKNTGSTNRQRTKRSDELVIQSHEYKHPEYEGVDVTLTTGNHAKNTSMAMNNRVGFGGENVVILDEYESSSISFSGHERLTEHFHSLNLTGDDIIEKGKEKITTVEKIRRRGKDIGSPASFTHTSNIATVDSRLLTNPSDIEWRSIEADQGKYRQSKREN